MKEQLDQIISYQSVPPDINSKDMIGYESLPFDIENQDSGVEIEIQQPNGLERIYDYFIKENAGNPIAFRRSDKVGLFLEVLGGSGGIYAWPPAWQYAKGMAPWLAYSFAITNPISNVLFLIRATDDLIDNVQYELQVPEQLKELMELPTKKSLAVKYIKMGVGSIICVIPFGLAVYMFPLPDCTADWCLSITVAHSIVTNTILHAVSWNLILADQYWYYRLPFLPFEKFYSSVKSCLSSPDQRTFLRLQKEQQAFYEQYKQILSETFASTAEGIVTGYLKKNDSSRTALRRIQDDDMSLIQFVTSYGARPPVAPQQPVSYFRSFLNKTNSVLSNGGVGLIGASIMVVGCMGWIADPFYVGDLMGLNLAENIGFGSLPAYSTAVLCAFYGSAVFNQIYGYMTTWPGIRDKFSMEAQLFPKTFSLFLLANIYVSLFAYAAGDELIATVFSDSMWDDIRPALQGIAIPTLQLLSFIPLLELFNVVTRKVVAKYGSLENDETLAARLLLKTQAIKHYLKQMKGKELIEILEKFTPEQQRVFGLDPEKFKQDLVSLKRISDEVDNLKLPGPSFQNTRRHRFLGSKPTIQDDEKSNLLTQGMSPAK